MSAQDPETILAIGIVLLGLSVAVVFVAIGGHAAFFRKH